MPTSAPTPPGERLRRMIDRMDDGSVSSASDRVGCSRAYLYRLVAGEATPGRALANRIAREYGIPSAAWDVTP